MGTFCISGGRGNALALREGFGYFSSGLSMFWNIGAGWTRHGRNMALAAILCRERGWAKSRALYELQNGLPYRTFPAGTCDRLA